MDTNSGETQTYTYDYSHGNIGKIIPTSPVVNPFHYNGDYSQFSGKNVDITITFTDMYMNSRGASNYFLCLSSDQNPS
ncbi:MAG: hypothetical protein HRT68_05350 [Flavobacteriaceae bacterium]|nr:hypothetical protein [Flavobacteriaceae bacterium]